MSTVNVFFARMSSCRYVFGDGSEAAFVGGRYTTDDPNKIAELNREIKLNHPHIYVDSAMVQVNSEDLDPMAVLKKRIIEEAIAAGELQRTNPTESFSQQGALKPSSSADLVDVKSAEETTLSELGPTPAPVIPSSLLAAMTAKKS